MNALSTYGVLAKEWKGGAPQLLSTFDETLLLLMLCHGCLMYQSSVRIRLQPQYSKHRSHYHAYGIFEACTANVSTACA